MEYLVRIVEGTPWWVWLLFAYLVVRGIKALRPSTGPVWRFAILPAVFLAWGIASLANDFGITALSAGSYLAGLAVGAGLGWLMPGGQAIRADRAHGLVQVPGGPTTLFLILAIFAVKYCFGVWMGMEPEVIAQGWFVMANCGLSGLIAGMFAGRFARLVRAYRTRPEEDLSAQAS